MEVCGVSPVPALVVLMARELLAGSCSGIRLEKATPGEKLQGDDAVSPAIHRRPVQLEAWRWIYGWLAPYC
jgi:hypothetical protein